MCNLYLFPTGKWTSKTDHAKYMSLLAYEVGLKINCKQGLFHGDVALLSIEVQEKGRQAVSGSRHSISKFILTFNKTKWKKLFIQHHNRH